MRVYVYVCVCVLVTQFLLFAVCCWLCNLPIFSVASVVVVVAVSGYVKLIANNPSFVCTIHTYIHTIYIVV